MSHRPRHRAAPTLLTGLREAEARTKYPTARWVPPGRGRHRLWQPIDVLRWPLHAFGIAP